MLIKALTIVKIALLYFEHLLSPSFKDQLLRFLRSSCACGWSRHVVERGGRAAGRGGAAVLAGCCHRGLAVVLLRVPAAVRAQGVGAR